MALYQDRLGPRVAGNGGGAMARRVDNGVTFRRGSLRPRRLSPMTVGNLGTQGSGLNSVTSVLYMTNPIHSPPHDFRDPRKTASIAIQLTAVAEVLRHNNSRLGLDPAADSIMKRLRRNFTFYSTVASGT
jgi:hypothetical protein